VRERAGNELLLDLLFWPVFAVYPLVVPWSLLQRRAATPRHRYGAPLQARFARGLST
jgi:hypothetical protein